MDILRHQQFYVGLVSGLLWTTVVVMLIIQFRADLNFSQSFSFLKQNHRLNDIILLATAVNVPIFIIAIKRNRIPFAAGIVGTCLLSFLLQFII